METKTNKNDVCPHCGKKLYINLPEYFYGTPFRNCTNCNGEYIDYRYHEIAIEGVREQDMRLPTKEEKKEDRKIALIGLIVFVLCSLLLIGTIWFLGRFYFILPIGAIVGLLTFFSGFKKKTQKTLNKEIKAIEIEKNESIKRLQNPNYVEKLRAAGYVIPEEYCQHNVIDYSETYQQVAGYNQPE